MKRTFHIVSAATTAAAAVLLAGCGGSDSSTADGGGTNAASTHTVSKSAKDVVLSAADLPAGIDVLPVTDAQLQSALDQITTSAGTLKAVPAECGSKTAIVDATARLDVSKFGMIAGSSKSGLVSESVLVAHPDIAKLRSAFIGPCKTMTADLTSQGVSVSSQITRTVLDTPKGRATDLLVVREDSTSDAAGQRVKQQSYQGYAQVGGYAVTVSVKAMTGAPDKKLFDELLTKSIDKAAQA
ncbi:hypothetical protein [Tsukamurella tyrosinosolvens]|uniref:hypothetical protein n=1 Tax=Tsukamurella tyrosinosolvens TaxID=57704 RepID=UPI003F49E759